MTSIWEVKVWDWFCRVGTTQRYSCDTCSAACSGLLPSSATIVGRRSLSMTIRRFSKTMYDCWARWGLWIVVEEGRVG